MLLVASVRCLHVFGVPPQESCRTGPRCTDPLDLFIWGGPLEASWRHPIEAGQGAYQVRTQFLQGAETADVAPLHDFFDVVEVVQSLL